MDDTLISKITLHDQSVENSPRLIPIVRHSDNRGYFQEIYKSSSFQTDINQEFAVLQINHAFSHKNVFRGIHQSRVQNKLITCVSGKIIDFAVDLRNESSNFGKIYYTELSQNEPISFFIPKSFGHGYLTLEENTLVTYMVDNEYVQGEELNWDGSEILRQLQFTTEEIRYSDKDQSARRLPTKLI